MPHVTNSFATPVISPHQCAFLQRTITPLPLGRSPNRLYSR